MTSKNFLKNALLQSVFRMQEERSLIILKIIAVVLFFAFFSSNLFLKVVGCMALPLIAYLLVYHYQYTPEKNRKKGFIIRLWVISILTATIPAIFGEGAVSLNMLFIPTLVITAIFYVNETGSHKNKLIQSGAIFIFIGIVSTMIKGGMGAILFVWFMASLFKSEGDNGGGRLLIQTGFMYFAFYHIWGGYTQAILPTIVGALYILVIYIVQRYSNEVERA